MKSIAKSIVKNLLPPSWVQFKSGSDRSICLTFDDGPHPNTEKILDILKQHNVKASFFVNGCVVKKYPAIAKKISDAGHFIGNHFFDHVSVKTLDAAQMQRQVEDTEALVKEVTGKPISAVRPPYGDWNLQFFRYAVGSGRRIIFWSVDSEDGDPETSKAQSIREHCASLSGGDILLMHDDNAQTLEVLPEIIAAARKKGLEFETVERHP